MIARDESATAAPRRPVKSETAFRTISEVSEDLEVPQHVLRFWESKFSQIKPLKRGGGRRYYRPEDLQILKHIRDLLYKDGYTIKGVQKLLRDEGKGPAGRRPAGEAAPADPALPPEPPVAADSVAETAAAAILASPAPAPDIRRASLQAVCDELLALQEMLRKARGV